MIQRFEYIEYLHKFSKRLNSVINKIDKKKSELTDKDSDIIEITVEAFLKSQQR